MECIHIPAPSDKASDQIRHAVTTSRRIALRECRTRQSKKCIAAIQLAALISKLECLAATLDRGGQNNA